MSTELQRLLDQEPFVRSLAHALVAADADEVVQRTWLRALQSDARAVRRPRQWLATVMRSVVRNLRRGEARRDTHERAAARREGVPSSAELMQREERRRELVQAVDALREPLRAVVLLRWFDGLPPRAIAQRLGIPVNTVYARLRIALATLRQRLDDGHGDARAWLLPLLPVAMRSGALATGLLAMATSKIKLLGGVAALAVAALVLWGLAGSPSVAQPGPVGPPQPPPLVADLAERHRGTDAAPVERTVAATPPPASATTGSLVVTVVHAEDRSPVPDLLLSLGQRGADHRVGRRRVHTDERGMGRFTELAPGRWNLANARDPFLATPANVAAGVENALELELPHGMLLAGIVVDRDDVPVPGADVFLAPPSLSWVDAERVVTTAADGRFELRSCPSVFVVGAAAEGHAPSDMTLVDLQRVPKGTRKDVRLVLPAAGGSVEGMVFDADGLPVADAFVLVGDGLPASIQPRGDRAAPLPAQARTDRDGRFRAVGIAAGEQPVRVRAARMAPWTGTCRITAHAVTPLQVTLAPGVSCAGIVVDAADVAVAGVRVEAGDGKDLAHRATYSAADGTFRLDGLQAGEVELRAWHSGGRATALVRGAPGETVPCTLRLDAGLELRGRVLTTAGAPVARAEVGLHADATGADAYWYGYAFTAADGAFRITNCPRGRTFTLQVGAPGVRRQRIAGVDPAAGELTVRVEAPPAPSARIRGRVVGPDGRPVVHASVSGYCAEMATSSEGASSPDGAFALGPLIPGRWTLAIRADGHPTWSELRQLDAGAVWDLGTIALVIGGTIRVRVDDPDERAPFVTIADAGCARWTAVAEGDERRSEPLAPGAYYVSVAGKGVARQLIPVEVRAGEVSEVDVRVEAGHRQRIAFDPPAPLRERRVRVWRGDRLVFDRAERATEDVALAREQVHWLGPGDYLLTATGDGLAGEARFTLRAGTGAGSAADSDAPVNVRVVMR